MSSHHSRVQAGVATGGQFAPERRGEPAPLDHLGNDLDSPHDATAQAAAFANAPFPHGPVAARDQAARRLVEEMAGCTGPAARTLWLDSRRPVSIPAPPRPALTVEEANFLADRGFITDDVELMNAAMVPASNLLDAPTITPERFAVLLCDRQLLRSLAGNGWAKERALAADLNDLRAPSALPAPTRRPTGSSLSTVTRNGPRGWTGPRRSGATNHTIVQTTRHDLDDLHRMVGLYADHDWTVKAIALADRGHTATTLAHYGHDLGRRHSPEELRATAVPPEDLRNFAENGITITDAKTFHKGGIGLTAMRKPTCTRFQAGFGRVPTVGQPTRSSRLTSFQTRAIA